MEEGKELKIVPFNHYVDIYGWKEIEEGDEFAMQSIDFVFKVTIVTKPKNIEDRTSFKVEVMFVEIVGYTNERKKFLKEAEELVRDKVKTEIQSNLLFKIV